MDLGKSISAVKEERNSALGEKCSTKRGREMELWEDGEILTIGSKHFYECVLTLPLTHLSKVFYVKDPGLGAGGDYTHTHTHTHTHMRARNCCPLLPQQECSGVTEPSSRMLISTLQIREDFQKRQDQN